MSYHSAIPQSATEEVTRYLHRQLLVRKRFQPGSFIRENDVATELNVSRSPVREALKVLESYGIVKTLPRRGALVLQYTNADVGEIYDVRVLLESKVYSRIVKNHLLNDEHYRHLMKCIDDYRDIRTTFEKNLQEGQLDFFDLECRFHFYIHEISGLSWTSELLKKTYSRLFQYMIHNVGLEDLDSILTFHTNIVENLRSGDLAALEENRIESYMLDKAYRPDK
ncbi:GntR family transcriptional regulator [Pyramidobacter piscolens]|uniref:GntR family transcriptional regulator n=1 Tax=Pyramidobacter piscolens TaxID=638849 RepID=UPI002AB1BB23|nr:GntR family transcriptional regulator [Pyramidobacter piscolens]